jgi:hypothetical protein
MSGSVGVNGTIWSRGGGPLLTGAAACGGTCGGIGVAGRCDDCAEICRRFNSAVVRLAATLTDSFGGGTVLLCGTGLTADDPRTARGESDGLGPGTTAAPAVAPVSSVATAEFCGAGCGLSATTTIMAAAIDKPVIAAVRILERRELLGGG